MVYSTIWFGKTGETVSDFINSETVTAVRSPAGGLVGISFIAERATTQSSVKAPKSRLSVKSKRVRLRRHQKCKLRNSYRLMST